MRQVLILLFFVSLAAAGLGYADEGMWLFNAFPADRTKAQYGFAPSQQWLDHVRLASVRFNNGGSGSFVSADGLTFTNHHVGADCIQELSTQGKDHMKAGFYARTRAEEAKCPALELNVLVGIEDVTLQVQAAAKPDMTPPQVGAAQRAAMSAIEKECATKTGQRCDVVTLYSGGQYHLYQYKKYTDVRLVFAPEFDIAFFGGDPDNFEYPRYDLDITFFRVYENDKPVQLEHYFKWSRAGAKEGDLVFVPGNPGSTARLNTLAQLEYTRDLYHPWVLKTYTARLDMLKAFQTESAENARIAQEARFGVENNVKRFIGYQGGLTDKELWAKKASDEQKLREFVNADPKRKADFTGAWDTIAEAVKIQRETFLPYQYLDKRAGFRGEMAFYARHLVRLAEEKQKPNAQRLREYRESALPSLEDELFSTAPVYKSLETALLAFSLEEMRAHLGDGDAVVRKVLDGRTPAEAARQLVAGSTLDDPKVRRQLYDVGAAAVQASDDPLIRMMVAIEPEARTIRKRYDDEVDAVFKAQGGRIAQARFAMAGKDVYPDATFTPRLSYGAVKGFIEKGKPVPYYTVMGGAFDRAGQHNNLPPFQLPESWMKAKAKIKAKTPFNAVSTADIIGGNSGSPVINTKAEVVGIIFDGNLQSLPWNFMFSDQQGRSVHVDSRGIIEALRSIYDAAPLVEELTGKKK